MWVNSCLFVHHQWGSAIIINLELCFRPPGKCRSNVHPLALFWFSANCRGKYLAPLYLNAPLCTPGSHWLFQSAVMRWAGSVQGESDSFCFSFGIVCWFAYHVWHGPSPDRTNAQPTCLSALSWLLMIATNPQNDSFWKSALKLCLIHLYSILVVQ